MHVQTNKHWKEVIPYLQDKITQEKVTPTLLKKKLRVILLTLWDYTFCQQSRREEKRRFKSLLVFLFFAYISFLYGFYFTSGEKMGMSEQAPCYSYHI